MHSGSHVGRVERQLAMDLLRIVGLADLLTRPTTAVLAGLAALWIPTPSPFAIGQEDSHFFPGGRANEFPEILLPSVVWIPE